MGSSRACCSCSSCCRENNSYPKQNLLIFTDQLQSANPGEVLSGCCTCEAAAVPSESSSCSLVVPFEDLGTVLPFHLGDNHHQHSAAFVNRVRCLFEFTFNLQNNFYRYQVRSLTQSVSLLKSFLFDFVNIVL